jgi:hypothetical protein
MESIMQWFYYKSSEFCNHFNTLSERCDIPHFKKSELCNNCYTLKVNYAVFLIQIEWILQYFWDKIERINATILKQKRANYAIVLYK